ncbi:DNA (cytosine-5)-methyltransferase 1 [Nocardia tenerifensis]|uniref:DNA (Cytosine-5)-methyltransferase 1 n=1 Tax=Nocardia tenerifensis TaxID=228006 RepID=A0A318JNY4_9NOCA|nr:DNA cytosine methyltransferase [Nocardia tenerifensis]PXX53918.1 DNA (cytosine-5)-methyltransferase 1 [Nocardia tenerifensis]
MLKLMDWFCGAGGSTQGASKVPWVHIERAANHWDKAIETHATNYPEADHFLGDLSTDEAKAQIVKWPVADLFWASPECPQWSSARGKRRDYDNTLQGDLLDLARDEEADRSRALMEEVPMYLRGVIERGGRVRAGVVENVVEVRQWDQWNRWIGEIRALGYGVKVIALNSGHAQPVRTPAAPQSRDRLYVAYWDLQLGREPDWNKWLRPLAYCQACDEWVHALQVFKRPGADMGRYRTQYVYRCPHVSCRNAIVEPPALPAAAAIDWTLPGTRIGDRERPLAPKTMDRIRVGLRRYASAVPMMVPAGGTWRADAAQVTGPMAARTTRENDGLAIPRPFLALLRSDRPRTIGLHEPLATIVADGSNHGLVVPPLMVPMEGRDGKDAQLASLPLRTQTTRNETAVAFVPFVAELRGGSSDARPVTEALATVTASGNHHGLVTPPNGMSPELWNALLLPYYGTGTARPVSDPMGTLSTRDRFALVDEVTERDIEDVRFRMLEPGEIQDAMAFRKDYIVLGNKRQQVRQLGNAVTPPAAEILISALVEAITGEELDRYAHAA